MLRNLVRGTRKNMMWRRWMGTTIPYNLTDIGEGIAEVEVIEWFVSEGDEVKQFDKVCEVQSDKANVEITSRYDGVVKELVYGVGDTAHVGKPLMMIEIEEVTDEHHQKNEEVQNTQEVEVNDDERSVIQRSRQLGNEKILTTPAVRRIAREHDVDLQLILGTGKDGRIMKSDVLEFVKNGHVPVQQQEEASTPSPQAAVPPVAAPVRPAQTSTEPTVIPVKGIQKAMLQSMTASLSIPHFGYCDEIEMTRAMEFRRQLQSSSAASETKVTMMPILLKAASLALKEYPVLNSSLSDCQTQLIQHASHNMGFAMDTPRGLLVPVIRDVQNLSILQIASEMERLQKLGQASKLSGEDLSDCTFSLSNIGSIGGTYASPVIAPPQVAIGALGRIQKLPRFDEDENVIAARVMQVSWAADHRIIDGATMARFSNLMKDYLEEPAVMAGAMC